MRSNVANCNETTAIIIHFIFTQIVMQSQILKSLTHLNRIKNPLYSAGLM